MNNISEAIDNLHRTGLISQFISNNTFVPELEITENIFNSTPLYMSEGNDFYIKFVIKEKYIKGDFNTIDYRYPVVIYLNANENLLDIRFDGFKHNEENQSSIEKFTKIYNYCVAWITNNIGINIFKCDNSSIYESVKNDCSGKVKIYRQMMTLATGGSADLTADYYEDNPILPFIDELRELINENALLFDESPKIKDLLTKFIDDKEDTAEYPYIYIKCINGAESQNFSVKITSSYVCENMTLQYLSGNNKTGMERMNYVIKFLKKINAIVKGEQIN